LFQYFDNQNIICFVTFRAIVLLSLLIINTKIISSFLRKLSIFQNNESIFISDSFVFELILENIMHKALGKYFFVV